MNNQPTYLYTIYYSILTVIIAAFALQTIVQTSQTLLYADQVAQLEKSKRQLVREHSQLKQQVAQRSSLNQVALRSPDQSYQAISSPLVVSHTSTVALR